MPSSMPGYNRLPPRAEVYDSIRSPENDLMDTVAHLQLEVEVQWGPSRPESACLSRIKRVRLSTKGSRVDKYIRVRPTKHAKVHLGFRGHLRSPPHYLPRQTAPDSSSGFCSLNFWSDPSTSVGSPPLPRKGNPESRIPNCSSDGSRETTYNLSFHTFY